MKKKTSLSVKLIAAFMVAILGSVLICALLTHSKVKSVLNSNMQLTSEQTLSSAMTSLQTYEKTISLPVDLLTRKDSIKQLNKRELGVMVSVLAGMKDSSTKGAKKRKHQTGNPATVNQRKKVYKLAEELGWTKKARINGFCRRMFGVESVDWLNYMQCSDLIEALKSMVERMEKEDGK